MNSDTGNELLRFVSRFLETRGAALEIKDDGLDALLPEKISGLLQIPEYIRVRCSTEDESDDHYLVHYGAPLVDKMIEAACAETPLLACDLRFEYMKSDGFDRLIKDQFHFNDITGRVQSSANIKTDYLILACRYTALSDEQKEGLIYLAFNYETCAYVPNMVGLLSNADKVFRTEGKNAPDEKRLREILKQINARSEEVIMEEIMPFKESMARRFRRDAGNLEEYYKALEKEMRSNLERQGLSDELIRDRKEKIDLIPVELERKKDDLLKKYSIRINIAPCAIMFIRTPAVKILYSLSGQGKHKTLSFFYNPVRKSIDPIVCQGCGTSIFDIYRCKELHILCEECRKRCPVCRH